MNLFYFGLSKMEMGTKTASWMPKLGYFNERVFCHTYIITEQDLHLSYTNELGKTHIKKSVFF